MVYHLSFGARLNFPEVWGDERFDVWTIAIPQSNFKDKKIHEFQKPLNLLRRIISIGSHERDLVLDCFYGFWNNWNSLCEYKKKLYRNRERS